MFGNSFLVSRDFILNIADVVLLYQKIYHYSESNLVPETVVVVVVFIYLLKWLFLFSILNMHFA